MLNQKTSGTQAERLRDQLGANQSIPRILAPNVGTGSRAYVQLPQNPDSSITPVQTMIEMLRRNRQLAGY